MIFDVNIWSPSRNQWCDVHNECNEKKSSEKREDLLLETSTEVLKVRIAIPYYKNKLSFRIKLKQERARSPTVEYFVCTEEFRVQFPASPSFLEKEISRR